MPEARNEPSLLQVLSAAMQNIPVVLANSQSADPQRQLPSFADVPSMVAHVAGGREHVLDAAVQTRPVPCPSPFILVHASSPQMQGVALLGADPSVFVQAEAVTPEA